MKLKSKFLILPRRMGGGTTRTCTSVGTNRITEQPQKWIKPKFAWLDLQGTGLSALERLCLEEALLRHDPLKRNWAIMGTHDPVYNTRLKKIRNSNKNNNNTMYENCVVVMGLGGKPHQLLNVDRIKQDGVLVLKRFSGGGTVVVDQSCLWTTFIGRPESMNHIVAPYPRDIMQWSAKYIFESVFNSMNQTVQQTHETTDSHHRVFYPNTLCVQKETPKTLILDTKSCGLAGGNTSTLGRVPSIPTSHVSLNSQRAYDVTSEEVRHDSHYPTFALRENDYVFGERKMGGNAQSISKDGWLHHTSFLWDFVDEHMEYLTLPSKRPEYRKDRKHTDFLIKLKYFYSHGLHEHRAKKRFFDQVKVSCAREYDLEHVLLKDVMDMLDSVLGGFQHWFETKSRTSIVDIK